MPETTDMSWVPIHELTIDGRYQRQPDAGLVEALMAWWCEGRDEEDHRGV